MTTPNIPTPNPPLQRITLIGAECTGKTTLAKALAKRFNTLWVGEYLRFYFDQKGVGFQSCLADIMPIAYGQLNTENQAAQHATRFLFCDTNLILLAVYSEYYFGQVPDELERLIVTQIGHQHYAHTLLTDDTGIAWVADGQRGLPFGRAMMRQKIVDKLTYYGASFTPITGSLGERLNAIQHLLGN